MEPVDFHYLEGGDIDTSNSMETSKEQVNDTPLVTSEVKHEPRQGLKRRHVFVCGLLFMVALATAFLLGLSLRYFTMLYMLVSLMRV